MKNPCIRCGKKRIDGKVWTEMVGQTLLTHTQTVCPDLACQKIVDEEFDKARKKKELLLNSRKIKSKNFGTKAS